VLRYILSQLRTLFLPLLIAGIAALALPAAVRYMERRGVCRRCDEPLSGRGLVQCKWCGKRALILRF
jgi:hypothetical protein